MNKITKTITVIAVVSLLGFLLFLTSSLEEESLTTDNENEAVESEETEEGGMTSLVQCLGDEGVTIYGSSWCPYCTDLVESFGGYDVVDPVYVECTEEEGRCMEEMIGSGVPEIQIKGEMYRGSRDPEGIAEAVGCV